MQTIALHPLSKGKSALISDVDLTEASRYHRWRYFPPKGATSESAYAVDALGKLGIGLRRLIGFRAGLHGPVRHKDGNWLNFQRDNLEPVHPPESR
jgi:hypothetical protein